MRLKRRDFLKGTAASLAAALVPASAHSASSSTAPTRTLGRTGLEVAPLGYGAMQVSDPAIIRHGLDRGINYIDTADCYMGGRNEKVVGKAIAGIRDRVIIATKVHIGRETKMRRSVDRSLASLGVNSVDIMQLHGLYSRHQVLHEDTKRYMAQMQKEGKFRFTAVTTHSNQEDVLEAVVEDGFYDAVLVAVNFRSPQSLFSAIEQAAAAGVGIIAMKTQNGGYNDDDLPGLTPHQAALRFVLEKPGVHLAVPGMLSRKMVDENFGAVQGTAGLADLLRLESYREQLQGQACSFCSRCISECRFGTGGLDVARIKMYTEGYRDRDLAAEQAKDVAESITRCVTCTGCTVRCSQGIDLQDAARKAASYLA